MAEIDDGKIARLAGRLRLLLWMLIGFSVAAYLAGVLGLRLGGLRIVSQDLLAGVPGIAWVRHASFLLLLLALTQLGAMLGAIRAGQHFSSGVTRPFRRFALLLFLATALTFFGPTALALAAQHAPHAVLQVALNLRELSTMIVAGALFLVARLLDQAQQVETTLSEFV